MDKKQLSFIITLGIIAAIVITIFIFKKTDYSHFTFKCDDSVSAILFKYNVSIKAPLKTTPHYASGFRKKAQSMEKEFILAQNQSLAEIKKSFIGSADFTPLQMGKIQKRQTKSEHTLTIDFFYKDLKLYRLILRQKITIANIALVIDDWGYSDKVLEKSFALRIPLTYAVLPNLPYSLTIAKEANQNGHEVILHLPLEPYNAENHPLEKNTIFTSMSQDEIEQIIKDNIASIPHLKGINNHMGSKATESKYVLDILFDQIINHNLYFLDSYTSNDSLASKVALEKQLSFIKRDIFIDNVNTKEHIRGQLLRVKNLAAKNGQAVAIGHAKDLTMDTLKEIVPEFEKEGFRFVLLSDFLKNKKQAPTE